MSSARCWSRWTKSSKRYWQTLTFQMPTMCADWSTWKWARCVWPKRIFCMQSGWHPAILTWTIIMDGSCVKTDASASRSRISTRRWRTGPISLPRRRLTTLAYAAWNWRTKLQPSVISLRRFNLNRAIPQPTQIWPKYITSAVIMSGRGFISVASQKPV